jgi:hypothetical protein
MGKMKHLQIKIDNGDELTESEREAVIHSVLEHRARIKGKTSATEPESKTPAKFVKTKDERWLR